MSNKINVAYDGTFLLTETNQLKVPYPNLVNYTPMGYMIWDFPFTSIKNVENYYNVKFPISVNDDISEHMRKFFGRMRAHQLGEQLDNTHYNFIEKETYDLIFEDVNFVYPIVIVKANWFDLHKNVLIKNDVIRAVKRKKAKIVFFQFFEGNFGLNDINYILLSNISKLYHLDKEDLCIVTPNLKALERYNILLNQGVIEKEYTVYPYSYFQHSLWFHPQGTKMLNQNVVADVMRAFNENLKNRIESKKIYHFLCFNRRPREHRLPIFAEILLNESLKNKTIVTLGRNETNDEHCFKSMVNDLISDDYSYGKDRLIEFFEHYDLNNHYTFDCDDLENNKANLVNKTAHTISFINIVTETHHLENTIFFSEKIFKPMYMCQPFILIGNPLSLKKLKEMGFKTFDKWWDESYDDEMDFTRRFEKIMKIIHEISTWDMEKCHSVTKDMTDILIHNFNVMVSNKNMIKLYDFLGTYSSENTVSLI
jgi:hypothetical protein